MSIQPGRKLLQYELVEQIGEGGMGEVWVAEDTVLDRRVAIKVLPPGFGTDGDRLARFEREAKAVAALSHPNILAIYDFGSHDGQTFAVMELLEGESLRERLSGGALPTHKAVEYATQIARGLAAAHDRGVIHRDLKPENVFVTRDGIVKILDFGLAKIQERDTGDLTSTPTRTHLTEPGSVLGTVAYMSPEQVRGEVADHRSDLFSFGTVLYEMLAGQRPFDHGTSAETMTAILREEPREPTEVDAATVRVAYHCLEKRPDERFQSARDLVFTLESMSGSSHTSISSPPTSTPGASIDPSVEPGRSRRFTTRLFLTAGAVLAAGAVIGFVASRLAGDPASVSRQASPEFQRVTFARGTVDAARFARDGSTIVYSAQWRGRKPELFSITSGSAQSLSLGIEGARLLGMSSKGELVVQLDAVVSTGVLVGTLARVQMGSAAPRDVDDDIVEADWTADGNELVIMRQRGYRRFIESPPGNVLFETQKFTRYVRASPTGSRIALFAPRTVGGTSGDLMLIDASGDERVLTECRCTGISWNATGSEVWLTERMPGGGTRLAAVTIDGARREIYRTAGHAVLQDIASDGRLLVSYGEVQSGILGVTPGFDEERDLSWLDGTLVAALSEDGRQLLFNEIGSGGGPSGSFYLRDLTSDNPAVLLGTGRAVALSPDARFVLAYEPEVSGQYKIVPTGAGPTRTIDLGDIQSVWGWFVPGTDQILFNGREPDRDWRFYTVSREGGPVTPVSPEGLDHYQGQLPLAPDGKRIAGIISQTTEGSARIYDPDVGEYLDMPGYEPTDAMLRWTDDGSGMIVFHRDSLPAPVYLLDTATGQRSEVLSLMPTDAAGIRGIERLSLVQDGRYYAYNYTRQLDVLYVIQWLED